MVSSDDFVRTGYGTKWAAVSIGSNRVVRPHRFRGPTCWLRDRWPVGSSGASEGFFAMRAAA